jgi:hydroxymethylpyrimidine pyrophosphatase-like HAD family hydrolase
MERYRSAIQIFKILMSKGDFNRRENPELYSEYLDLEVQEALAVLEQEFNCRFLHFDDTVYLIPSIDSEVLGVQPAELRSYFGSNATRREVFLGFYIMMFIFHEFYSGKNKDPKKMDFLQVSVLIDRLDERFDRLMDMSEEEREELEKKYQINLSSSMDVWSNMLVDHETKQRTKYNLIKRVCKILEDQKLAYLVEDQIRTTPRLDILMRQYYLHSDRVTLINQAFDRGEL